MVLKGVDYILAAAIRLLVEYYFPSAIFCLGPTGWARRGTCRRWRARRCPAPPPSTPPPSTRPAAGHAPAPRCAAPSEPYIKDVHKILGPSPPPCTHIATTSLTKLEYCVYPPALSSVRPSFMNGPFVRNSWYDRMLAGSTSSRTWRGVFQCAFLFRQLCMRNQRIKMGAVLLK